MSSVQKKLIKNLQKMLTNSILGVLFLALPSASFADAAPSLAGGGLASWGFVIVFFLIFYFMIMRPQQKRAKEHRDLVLGLQKGDEVIINGSLVGKISRVENNFFLVAISETGIEVGVQKQSVTGILPKGTLKSLYSKAISA